MATKLGKLIRKLRIDHGTTLRKMAETLGISSAYLSAIELGKRAVPNDFLHKLKESYALSESDYKELKDSVESFSSHFTVNLDSANARQKDVFIEFARMLDNLDSKDLEKINSVLENKNNE
ncbi:hypothetical protein A9G28_12780 [Gilliamella sp. Fer1-1]|jgi:HTH-type transcriptional regulator, competence development regulator|uniref:Helix-turn-helix transcriptional regulator n=1 Tax=Gilliamella apicola TaxID=1196095 RepID=A0A556S926_9GAMM|nr:MULTISPECIES: helix-turn-helix transcriptional regulator [Gilliamella]MBI0095998.1 helix-turn-helix transcriptional regulator [Gilliamella sp. W8136]OCG45145.1 hypothetical protein A9G28_12780 [Gilliamella apicola]OTQ80500.1 transcriptional regulator [Gilliamella sp. N-W3]TSJ97630.1 helix-turn-helix transcriptional regulator [Gilliamella apicola]